MTKVPIMREPVVEGEILPPNDPPPQVPPKPTTKGYTLDDLTRRRGESEADFHTAVAVLDRTKRGIAGQTLSQLTHAPRSCACARRGAGTWRCGGGGNRF